MAERKFSVDWTTCHTKDWTSWLKDCIGRPGMKGLEIGSHEGRSSCWFCANVLTGEGASLTCLDAWRDPKAEALFDSNTAGLRIEKRKAYSYFGLAELLIAGARFHFVYVDGGHTAEVLIGDLSMAWIMLTRNGILIADDYTLHTRNLPAPPRVAIDGWLLCVARSIRGYEFGSGQIAVFKPS